MNTLPVKAMPKTQLAIRFTLPQIAALSIALILLTAVFTSATTKNAAPEAADTQAYLYDKASRYMDDATLDTFYAHLEVVADNLEVPRQWLEAVIFNESSFDASVSNLRGSGAQGLIQFMPETCKTFKIDYKKLKNLGPVEQLPLIYKYLNYYKERDGAFQSLGDLYVAVLLPGVRKSPKKVLYSKPSKRYKQNDSLDENKDGRVDVVDIDMRMARLYPSASRITLKEYKHAKLVQQALIDGREDALEDKRKSHTYAVAYYEGYGQTLK